MKFPAQAHDLKSEGWLFDNEGRCRGCGAEIEWWLTKNGKKMPMSRVKIGDQLKQNVEGLQPHFADCPNAKDFRK